MTRLAACAAIILAVPAWAEPPKRYALLVAVGKYDHPDLPPLKYTENDAVELGKVLADPAHGYAVTTLADSTAIKPTRANVLAALKRVLDACKAGDTLVVGLAGHGLQFSGDDDAYFCPQDAKPVKARAAESMVSMKGLYDEMKGSNAGIKVLLVDACRNDPKAGRSIDPETVRSPAGVAALFSCSAGERSFETDKLGKGHGVFFHHVIQGLKGEAVNKRGEVTFASLVDHVQNAVVLDVDKLIGGGAKQQPNMKADLKGYSPVLVKLPKGPRPGDEIDIEIAAGVKMRFCWVPPGQFWMGAAEDEKEAEKGEGPQRLVKITKGIWLGKYEVTQEEYQTITSKNPSEFRLDGIRKDYIQKLTAAELRRLPVENVAWNDAKKFFVKAYAGLKKPLGYETYVLGLPTEAQWEYACRGDTNGGKKPPPFYWGNVLNGTEANCQGSTPYGTTDKGAYLERTSPVGSYATVKAHPWGLCDMHGNVDEWCEDYFGNYKDIRAEKDREAIVTPVQLNLQFDDRRVARGGSWIGLCWYCRAAYRLRLAPTVPSAGVGFRACFRPE